MDFLTDNKGLDIVIKYFQIITPPIGFFAFFLYIWRERKLKRYEVEIKIIAEAFINVTELVNSVEMWASPIGYGNDKDEKFMNDLGKIVPEAHRSYLMCRLFLKEKISWKINRIFELIEEIQNSYSAFAMYKGNNRSLGVSGDTVPYKEEETAYWKKAKEELPKVIAKIYEEITIDLAIFIKGRYNYYSDLIFFRLSKIFNKN